jgi:hypothetical protein
MNFVSGWWRNWKSHRAAMAELNRCGDDETAHIAHDIGLSASELQILAGKWPDAADLLPRRMSVLCLDKARILQTEAQVQRDLERVSSQRVQGRRCETDLNDNPGDRAWRGYCPNTMTLDALRSA